jgi:hypothetical protein
MEMEAMFTFLRELELMGANLDRFTWTRRDEETPPLDALLAELRELRK